MATSLLTDYTLNMYKDDTKQYKATEKKAKLLSIPTPVEAIFRGQMTEKPKGTAQSRKNDYQNKFSKDYGFAFLVPEGNFSQEFGVRTYETLKKHLKKSNITHITYNTFYRNDRKTRKNLRWLNAMCVEIDVKGKENADNAGLILPDVLDRVSVAGLPYPTTILQSPSGGFHLLWIYKTPFRATRKAVKVYGRIQKCIAEAVGGDLDAIGAEHYFRAPNPENVVYEGNSVHSSSLTDWYALECERKFAERGEQFKGVINFSTYNGALMQSKAFRDVQNGGFDDMRDRVSFSLACAYKIAGMTQREARVRLLSWNENNKKKMSRRELLGKIKSVYRSENRYVSYSFIRKAAEYLTGEEYPEKIYWNSRVAKPRSERVRSHFSEHEQDIIDYLKENEALIGSQRSIAATLKKPFSTFCKVLKDMILKGLLIVETKKGRGGFTLITLASDDSAPTKTPDQDARSSESHLNDSESAKQQSNTTRQKKAAESLCGQINVPLSNNSGKGVGGQARLSPSPSVPRTVSPTISFSGRAPIPANVPGRFISALFNRGFIDGRFVFAAWGRVQLAFNQFHIRSSSIPVVQDYMNLVVEAVSLTVGKKGSPTVGGYSGQDSFLKYLFGTVKGLLSNYRASEITEFVLDIGKVSEIKLLCLRQKYLDELRENDCHDIEKIKEFLEEIELEISARVRKKSSGKLGLFKRFSSHFKHDF
ncbi:RepB family DNA primase [Bacillus velezensis]|uniref:RepB family DNA primase n=1 Tax=Bacillus velezensis TaxID=492670 RepID=UPI0021F100C2|nr:RepB family DNA primase [Bacillus velezensis]MCV4329330.1 RepB family DNA primase [Bacillus velezensis]